MQSKEQLRVDRALQFGMPVANGALVSGGSSVNNATTATPFAPALLATTPTMAGKCVQIYCDAAGYVEFGRTSAEAVATSASVPLLPKDIKTFRMDMNYPFIAWISATGTATLYVRDLL